VKIGVKLVVVISVFNIIGIGLLAGVTLILAQREISRLADEEAQSIAREGSEKIGKWFEGRIGAARTLARVMEGYKEIPAAERRDYFNMMMRQLLDASQGIYANWAPNAVDGMDADYANTPGTDETGRYKSAWNLINGEFIVAPIAGFEWDMVMQTPVLHEEYILDPVVYQDPTMGNVLIAIMGSPVRDKETGVLLADVGSTLALVTIQEMVEQIKPFGDGYAMLFSPSGVVVAHSDPRRLGKKLWESESDTFGPFLDTIADAVTQGSPASFAYRSAQLDTVMQYYAVPFTIGQVPKPWTLVIGVSQATIMAPIYHMVTLSAIIGILTMFLMSAGVIVTARSISRPLSHTMTVLKDIAEGNLTRQIDIHSKDEVGELAGYINFTVDKIKRLVMVIKNQSVVLFDIGNDLASNMTETAATINEITANIRSIKGRTINQSASVTETNATMEQIAVNIKKLDGHVDRQSDSVARSSSAIEEMLANIQSVSQTLSKNTNNVKELMEASEIGRSGLQEVSMDIQEIARESEGLLEINAVMENIASQTNLLSMNAAIEAAHAGEAGKGFAVVANEIRKLAENSGEQSKTIFSVLKKIKDSIDKITKSTGNVLNKFAAIEHGVRTVSEQEENIRNAMEEQNAGSKQILEAVGQLNEVTRMVKDGSTQMLEGSGQVIQESKNLEIVTQEITNGMNEMATGADQINVAVRRVNEISGQNKENIDVLVREVSKFKVE
jgi:methyl-accepting chemotaxis protein